MRAPFFSGIRQLPLAGWLPSIFPAVFLLIANSLHGQGDSVIFVNDNYMIGEVKNMERGVLVVKTDYSDSDFKIEWEGVKEIYTESFFLITLTDGSRYNGTLSSTAPGEADLLVNSGDTVRTDLDDIVYLKSVDEKPLSRLYANISVGFSYAKARNFRQFSVRANAGYIANRWLADGYFSSVNSSQDDAETIDRTEGGFSFQFFLPKDWYLVASTTYLSNTEQKLALRTLGKFGVGKYLIHTNKVYWGTGLGLSYNNERFSNENPDRNSMEGYFGSQLNLFDLGDISLVTTLVAYPSFTEGGRWRVYYNFDGKYDLPLDFFISLGFSLNFDNRPVEGAARTDYVFQTTFGWEW
jgi:hypothetical protein